MALVSIVIPTRDRPGLLRKAIDAALGQDYPRIEIIVVDDGSGPETQRVIEEAPERDRRVRSLRHEQPRGAAAARNAGAALARGDYLLFEDDDCRGEPGRVRRLVEALEGDPSAGYAYSWSRLHGVGEGAGAAVRGRDGPWSIGTPAALIRADVFRSAGGFDAALPRLQDFDLWTRILAAHSSVEVREVLFQTLGDDRGISASPGRILEAAEHMRLKYADSDLPARHRARMHRMIGSALMLQGLTVEGRSHFLRALALHRSSLRSWVSAAVSLAGPRAFSAFARLHAASRRAAARLLAGSPE